MGSLAANSEVGVSPVSPDFTAPELGSNSDSETLEVAFSKIASNRGRDLGFGDRRSLEYGFKQNEGFSLRKNGSLPRKKKKKNQVFLEGYDEDDLTRTKSLTDEDLDELKGCVDLGFGFSYDEIPELCNTLPALELCYSISQKFLDEQQHKSPDASSPATASEGGSSPSGPIANWKISSPGDHPEEVKARLKFWAQAVACTVRLCS
uniref:Uncharacterized protein n=1 Tax=Kalanchoe fedtschenkoi TaxID=63787 RepID=A0A7N0ZWI7_KALFE